MSEFNISIPGGQSKRLLTGGKYVSEDILVTAEGSVQNSKTYEITIPKSSGLVLLTPLDDEVLSHINDNSFTALLVNNSPYQYEWYAGRAYFARNSSLGPTTVGSGVAYGFANRASGENNTSVGFCVHPANNTVDEYIQGELGCFVIRDGKYYVKPGDGFIAAGTYRLTVLW